MAVVRLPELCCQLAAQLSSLRAKISPYDVSDIYRTGGCDCRWTAGAHRAFWWMMSECKGWMRIVLIGSHLTYIAEGLLRPKICR